MVKYKKKRMKSVASIMLKTSAYNRRKRRSRTFPVALPPGLIDPRTQSQRDAADTTRATKIAKKLSGLDKNAQRRATRLAEKMGGLVPVPARVVIMKDGRIDLNRSGFGFQKGHSGNPSGRVKIPTEVIQTARANTLVAIAALVKVCQRGRNENAVVNAAEAILNRAWGKPLEKMELTGAEGGPIQHEDVTPLTVAEKAARILQILNAAGAEGAGQTVKTVHSRVASQPRAAV